MIGIYSNTFVSKISHGC